MTILYISFLNKKQKKKERKNMEYALAGLALCGFILIICGLCYFVADTLEVKNFIISLIMIVLGLTLIFNSMSLNDKGKCNNEKAQLEVALEEYDVYFNGERISRDAFTPDIILKNHFSYNINDDSLYIFSK